MIIMEIIIHNDNDHLFVTQVSLVKCDSRNLISLCNIKHSHQIAFFHQTLNEMPPQKARAANHSTSLTALFTRNTEPLLDLNWILIVDTFS